MHRYDYGRSGVIGVLVALALGACATGPQTRPGTHPTNTAATPAGWAARRGWTGHWAGTWRTTDAGYQMAGTAEIDVLERGELRGVLHAAGYEGRLSGQVRPSGRAHAAVYVADQQITLMLDGACAFAPSPRSAVATLEVFLRRIDVGEVRVELTSLPR